MLEIICFKAQALTFILTLLETFARSEQTTPKPQLSLKKLKNRGKKA